MASSSNRKSNSSGSNASKPTFRKASGAPAATPSTFSQASDYQNADYDDFGASSSALTQGKVVRTSSENRMQQTIASTGAPRVVSVKAAKSKPRSGKAVVAKQQAVAAAAAKAAQGSAQKPAQKVVVKRVGGKLVTTSVPAQGAASKQASPNATAQNAPVNQVPADAVPEVPSVKPSSYTAYAAKKSPKPSKRKPLNAAVDNQQTTQAQADAAETPAQDLDVLTGAAPAQQQAAASVASGKGTKRGFAGLGGRFKKRSANVVEATQPQEGKPKLVGQIIVGIVAVLVVAAIVAVFVFNSGVFAATDIQINGSEHMSAEAVQQLVNISDSTTLLSVDEEAIASSLKENPWVESVTVEREFPHTIKITPVEKTVKAVAYISSEDVAWAIASDRTWIAPVSTSVIVGSDGLYQSDGSEAGEGQTALTGADACLAVANHLGAILLVDVPGDINPVSGEAVSSKVVEAGLDYIDGFSSDFLLKIKNISVASVEAVGTNLTSGVEVSLGAAEDIESKEKVITKLLSQEEGVTYINVREADAYTFRAAPTSE